MGLLTSNISRLRNSTRLFQLPPYLALLCMIGGIAWMCLLPLDEYSRRTYISENALLPGQVHTYFSGSEQNIFRAYRHEVANVLEPKEQTDDQGNKNGVWMIATDGWRSQKLQEIFRNAGIKSATQTYNYESSGKIFKGENVYGIVKGPRADGTESIVLLAPIRNVDDELNINGVTLLLTLARYFSRWSLWSKDIILVITPDSAAGPQAWVDAYHSMHDPARVESLNLKSGHIQGAVCIDYPFDHRFETMHVAYDGVNGQLPNLDLINTAVSISWGQMGMKSSVQHQHKFASPDQQGHYLVRLRTLFRGMTNQALGHATGAHSVFMPYHIDAITLTAVGNGWEDEMAFGRVVESTTRSLNNLLEKLHQSFFFFLLVQNTRFVSIGTYLPSAMAIGAAFTIVAIFAWVHSGYENVEKSPQSSVKLQASKPTETSVKDSIEINKRGAALPTSKWKATDRKLILPIAYVATTQILSMIPIYLLTHFKARFLIIIFAQSAAVMLLAPILLAFTANVMSSKREISGSLAPHERSQFFSILSSISLLVLGLDLTVLATLNFSLSLFLGLLCGPLAFIGHRTPRLDAKPLHRLKNVFSAILAVVLSPPIVVVALATLDTMYLKSSLSHTDGVTPTLRNYLETEAFAFNVLGAWGIMVGVWVIWVPAWIIGTMGVVASFLPPESEAKQKPTSSSELSSRPEAVILAKKSK